VLILQPVQEVAHDGGVIPPPACWFVDLVIPIKKTDPAPIVVAPGQTNELGSVARDDDAQAAVFVRQNVEQAPVTNSLRSARTSFAAIMEQRFPEFPIRPSLACQNPLILLAPPNDQEIVHEYVWRA
jgi:hypothetical protein